MFSWCDFDDDDDDDDDGDGDDDDDDDNDDGDEGDGDGDRHGCRVSNIINIMEHRYYTLAWELSQESHHLELDGVRS